MGAKEEGIERAREGTELSTELLRVYEGRDTTRNGTVFSAAFYWRPSSTAFFIDFVRLLPDNTKYVTNSILFLASQSQSTHYILSDLLITKIFPNNKLLTCYLKFSGSIFCRFTSDFATIKI